MAFMEIKVAIGSVPKDGGTFTFYRNLRPALREYGIEMRCVTVGWQEAQLWEDAYADEGCVLLAPNTRSVKKQAMAFVAWCEAEGVDVVMGLNSVAILSALPHLPQHIRVLSRVAGGFDHGYWIALSGRERLAAIVATTPRVRKELIQNYGAPQGLVYLIPNGLDPMPFERAAAAPRGEAPYLRLGFLGRLTHHDKGVFHLVKIVRELNAKHIPFVLKIAGKGRHRSFLERAMEREISAGQVEFLGAIPPNEVPRFLAETDIFLFTSHFEGCPNTLLEAMMAGCVPVAWLIEGITDFIITQNENGFICPTGDYQCVVRYVEMLNEDRELLRDMGRAAAQTARTRFTNEKAAARYAQLFREVMAAPPPSWVPRSWSAFRVDPNFNHGWRDWARRIRPLVWMKEKMRYYADLRLMRKLVGEGTKR